MTYQTKRYYFHVMFFGKYAKNCNAIFQIRLYDKKTQKVLFQWTVRPCDRAMIEENEHE